MRVLHVSSSLSRNAGGIFEIELALAQQLKTLGIETAAVGLKDSSWNQDVERWESVATEVCPVIGPDSFGFSRALKPAINSFEPDVAHLHSLWMYTSIATTNWSQHSGRPYVVSPNGMLEPWALDRSKWKKRLARLVYENRTLANAACIHVNTPKELSDCRDFGLSNPVAIIPNGVSTPNPSPENAATAESPNILLFLGRIHPKKGILNAVKGWSETNNAGNWKFVIAGWSQNNHVDEIKAACNQGGVTWAEVQLEHFLKAPSSIQNASVVFVGPAFDDLKDKLLRSADAFILPSYSEGMPMSILEAWAYGLPVLKTRHCNLPEGYRCGAAIEITPEPDSIQSGLKQIMALSPNERRTMGASGMKLVQDQFTWSAVAAQMVDVYRWILGRCDRPQCIATN